MFYIWVKAGYQPNGPMQIGGVGDSRVHENATQRRHVRGVHMQDTQQPRDRNRYAVFDVEHGSSELDFNRQDMVRGRMP